MKPADRILIAALLAMVLAVWLGTHRFVFIEQSPGGVGMLWRCNLISGEVELSVAGGDWREIK